VVWVAILRCCSRHTLGWGSRWADPAETVDGVADPGVGIASGYSPEVFFSLACDEPTDPMFVLRTWIKRVSYDEERLPPECSYWEHWPRVGWASSPALVS